MKKFEFTLESLKKYNQQTLDSEKSVLGRLRAELTALQQSLEAKNAELDEAIQQTDVKMRKGVSVTELTVHKRYISALQQEIRLIQHNIAKKHQEIQAQLERVIEATKEVSKLEKLEEKQLEEYRYNERKEEERFIEEFVSNTSAQSGGE